MCELVPLHPIQTCIFLQVEAQLSFGTESASALYICFNKLQCAN